MPPPILALLNGFGNPVIIEYWWTLPIYDSVVAELVSGRYDCCLM